MKISATKQISKDFLLNIIASFVSAGTTQLVVYPLLAKQYGAEEYGVILTIMGIVNAITVTFGTGLCNARIVRNEVYKGKGIVGDFQILLIVCCIITGSLTLFSNLWFKQSSFVIIALIIAMVVLIMKSYYLCIYRIDIDYKKNLLANIAYAIGLIIGTAILIHFISWPWVFVVSSAFCLIYIGYTTPIIKEPVRRTVLFKETTTLTSNLLLSGLIGNAVIYLDRFLIYPILGAESVSVFSVASFFSKFLLLISGPIVGVMLSYFAADKVKVTKHRFIMFNLFFVFAAILFILLSITLGRLITNLLYAGIYPQSAPYVLLASTGVIIGMVSSFNGTIILVKAPSYWQVILSTIRIFLYAVLGIILLKTNGLYGLAWTVIISGSVIYFVNFVVGLKYISK